jgi:hypothetical protein
MGLPGLPNPQMAEVDRIMMEGLKVPVELMMGCFILTTYDDVLHNKQLDPHIGRNQV